MKSLVGDPMDKLKLAVYSDASFAGDLKDSRSTTGGVLCLVGENTFVPLSWICKKQGSVSHSSTEAEVVALDTMVRMEGLPTLHLWEHMVECFSAKGRTVGNNRTFSSRKDSAFGKYD